jgi:hypothetical protein
VSIALVMTTAGGGVGLNRDILLSEGCSLRFRRFRCDSVAAVAIRAATVAAAAAALAFTTAASIALRGDRFARACGNLNVGSLRASDRVVVAVIR